MPSIFVRESALQDLQTIKEICEKTGLQALFFWCRHYMKIKHKKRKLRGAELLVAEVNGRVVGVTLAFKNLVVGSVALLAVHPEHQRRGVGSMLLKEVCERLRKKSVRLIVLLMDPRAKADRRGELGKFYRRHGFKVLGILCIKKMESF